MEVLLRAQTNKQTNKQTTTTTTTTTSRYRVAMDNTLVSLVHMNALLTPVDFVGPLILTCDQKCDLYDLCILEVGLEGGSNVLMS